MRAQPQQVIEDAGNFIKHHTDILGALWHRDAHELFDCHHVGVLVDHHRDVVKAIHVRQILNIGTGFGEFFGRAMQQADMRVRALNDFTVELKYQPQDTVRGGVLRSKVHRVVLDFRHDYFRSA